MFAALVVPVPVFSSKATPFLYHWYWDGGDPSVSLQLSSTTVPVIAELGTSHIGVVGATGQWNCSCYSLNSIVYVTTVWQSQVRRWALMYMLRDYHFNGMRCWKRSWNPATEELSKIYELLKTEERVLLSSSSTTCCVILSPSINPRLSPENLFHLPSCIGLLLTERGWMNQEICSAATPLLCFNI